MFYEEGTKFTIGNSSPTRHNNRGSLPNAVMFLLSKDWWFDLFLLRLKGTGRQAGKVAH